MAALVLGERLRRWLRRAGSSHEAGERDYLPAPATPELVQAAERGADPSVSPADVAATLLSVARDCEIAAREEILDTLGTAQPHWWLAVDQALRQRWWSAPHWSRSLAADLADGDPDTLRLVVAASHHTGRIRQAAVIRLASRTHPATVAVLAIRTCDWVAEVRQSARTVVQNWPTLPQGPALRTLVQLASALRRRREGGWLARRVDQALRKLPLHRLGPLLTVRDRQTRRTAWAAAIATGQVSHNRLTRTAIKDGDLPIRTMCARAAVNAAAAPAQLRALLASTPHWSGLRHYTP